MLIDSLSTFEKPTRSEQLFVNFCRTIIKMPILNRMIFNSFKLSDRFINDLHRFGYLQECYQYSIDLLHKHFKNTRYSEQWWSVMRLVVSFLQEEQIKQLIVNPQLEEELIKLGATYTGEKIGYSVSYSFIGYSLWLFERAEVEESIYMAKIAAECDPNWGYPEYLIGWFGLFIGSNESVLHFKRAVDIDWNFLHRIKRDRTCQQFPDIIKEVGKNVVV